MTLSGIGELPLFKRRGSNVEELEALLDLLPNASLIVDGSNGRVLFSNAQVTQLTAYTRRELAELEIGTLLPGFPASALQKNGNTETAHTLVTRSSRSIQVKPKIENLGGPDHWVAISFQDPASETTNLAEVNRQRWEAMHMLSLALQQEDIHSCYRQILQAGSLLLEANQIALYVPLPDGTMTLESVIGSGVDFPIQLTQADLSHLRTPKIWQVGKPIESSLHRLANANKLNYLATSPLDLTNSDSGLLVTAESEKSAQVELLTLVQILAATAFTAQMNASVLEKVREKVVALDGSDQVRAVLHDNVQDGVMFINNKLSILEINPAAETMLGYTSAEVGGRSANEILVSSQSLQPALEQAWQESGLIEIGQRKILRRDGTEFLASLRLVPVEIDGTIEKVAVLITDLSEHEAFHIQTQQLQQRAAIGEITAIFAHEVRNPINSISTGLQLMQMNIPEQDPLQEQIKKLQEDVDRLEHRMKSVDTFSRNLEPHPEPLNLGDFCRSQLDRWRPRMNRKHITDHLQAAPETPAILGDRRALDQVFTNLITNAIQAMEDQNEGVLAIRVRPNQDDPSMVDLQISDSGPGIPEDIRKRIFEPFFTTKGQEGTGLGLAITRRIIMAHNGKIECESFPGGTLFKIQLPVAPAKVEEGNPA
jgi:PAS domain S-box-containing protein